MSAAVREREAECESLFVERWSPRGYKSDALGEEQIKVLFEAARWSPSCFNEQPWYFVYATEGEGKEKILSLLVDANRDWAQNAPLVAILFAKRNFAMDGTLNRHHSFDAGSAWLALALQAHKMGLAATAMGGFHVDQSYQTLNVSAEEYEAMAAIAVGYPAGDNGERSGRKTLSEVAHRI